MLSLNSFSNNQDESTALMISLRTSGILLHPTSLPGPFGVGDLGPAAYAFADFLIASGQSLWQVLPLGPTGYGDSPYSSYSAFAGNTVLISPQLLVAEGLLNQNDLPLAEVFPEHTVDFARASELKHELLSKAFINFAADVAADGDSPLRHQFTEFCLRNQSWLDDYALFISAREARSGLAWNDWETDLARREAAAVAREVDRLQTEIEAEKFFQFLFFRQWSALKTYCNARGVALIGDMPIFVAYDSADVWTAPDQFKLDSEGKPEVVAGVPPDYFSETGQFWGNPIYAWEKMRADGFQWWIRRMRAALATYDLVRMDHFRGFVACWEIPAGDQTAERGRWVDAPGSELFQALKKELGWLPIIAEDLGVITAEVDALRDEFGFPGMRVLQFGFNGDLNNFHLPNNYPANCVAFTGTHDNDTALGWFVGAGKSDREVCLEYLHANGEEIHWDFINAVLASPANTAIVPLQDVLGLGSEARMNVPNTIAGNWLWRFREVDLTEKLATRLRELSALHQRTPPGGEPATNE